MARMSKTFPKDQYDLLVNAAKEENRTLSSYLTMVLHNHVSEKAKETATTVQQRLKKLNK